MLSGLGDSQLIPKLSYRMASDKGLSLLFRQYLKLKGGLLSINMN